MRRRAFLAACAAAGVAGCRSDGLATGASDETGSAGGGGAPSGADARSTGTPGSATGGTAAANDTPDLRYTGLSDTERLPEDRGMLFAYGSVTDHTYVMREMEFGIDIVYADGEEAITSIHHAPAPGPGEDGSDQAYPGRGQYVLEVTYRWTTERGVERGDVLRFDR